MAVDQYALCPCGSGKKIKFCCADLIGDVEKIHGMIEGDQPRAALRHVEQTLAKKPGRASMLDLQAMLQLSLGEIDEARVTIEGYLAQHPDSPSAHAQHALLLIETENGRAAIAPLQRALELIDQDMPQRVLETIGAVGHALLVQGDIIASRAHLWLHTSINPTKESPALTLLVQMNRMGSLPLLMRENLFLHNFPNDVSWADEGANAAHLAAQGKWSAALEVIEDLDTEHGDLPEIVYNRALLYGWLGDSEMFVEGLHRYASLEGVPTDDAVEAEALAQMLDDKLEEQTLDSFLCTYEIKEFDSLIERLGKSKKTVAYDPDPNDHPSEDGPPPSHSFLLLDCDVPESGKDLTKNEVPHICGFLAVYGRQTDRQERLTLAIDKDDTFSETIENLKTIGGDALGDSVGEDEKIREFILVEQALSWRWHFPNDTPPDKRRELLAEEQLVAITERWPAVPRAALNGKNPLEAAKEESLRVPLLATILFLEQAAQSVSYFEQTRQLRDKLGLPEPATLQGDAIDAAHLPLVRLPRVDFPSLSDKNLLQLYRRCILADVSLLITLVCREAVTRDLEPMGLSKSVIYQQLATRHDDPGDALHWIDQAREWAESSGQSTGEWDLAEFTLQLRENNTDEAMRLLEHLRAEHFEEPGIAAAVYETLQMIGAIPPQGAEGSMPAMPMGEAADVESEQDGGKIWTPDSDQPASKKSALWTP